MVKQQLEVYGRVKPCLHAADAIPSFRLSDTSIQLQVSRAKLSNAKETQEFTFKGIFSEASQQQEVFEGVARPVIDNCLDGYNGTIFAYGQTGSGKTHTMSGGDCWEDRGIIPRVLTYIFEQFQLRSQYRYELTVSFMEIYNENAYDLLAAQEEATDARSKIIFFEDEQSNLQMKNIQAHEIASEHQGIKCLMEGNFLRKVNCTSLNQTSSRSHSIFTLSIRGTHLLTQAEIYSKLHLVDLAGSQRVSRSQAEGVVLAEAKSINLSLTYLEQVIVALNQRRQRSKQHIPYRNSLLTTLLKDSLGGNCKTVMIATITPEQSNLQETLSTLRFAQRVRLIQNEIVKNEKNIYSTQIETLQKENLYLKNQLARFQQVSLLPETEDQVSVKVESYLNESTILEVGSIEQAQRYFGKMREVYSRRMREYVTELTFISEKLMRYDEMLTKKNKKPLQAKN